MPSVVPHFWLTSTPCQVAVFYCRSILLNSSNIFSYQSSDIFIEITVPSPQSAGNNIVVLYTVQDDCAIKYSNNIFKVGSNFFFFFFFSCRREKPGTLAGHKSSCDVLTLFLKCRFSLVPWNKYAYKLFRSLFMRLYNEKIFLHVLCTSICPISCLTYYFKFFYKIKKIQNFCIYDEYEFLYSNSYLYISTRKLRLKRVRIRGLIKRSLYFVIIALVDIMYIINLFERRIMWST